MSKEAAQMSMAQTWMMGIANRFVSLKYRIITKVIRASISKG